MTSNNILLIGVFKPHNYSAFAGVAGPERVFMFFSDPQDLPDEGQALRRQTLVHEEVRLHAYTG